MEIFITLLFLLTILFCIYMMFRLIYCYDRIRNIMKATYRYSLEHLDDEEKALGIWDNLQAVDPIEVYLKFWRKPDSFFSEEFKKEVGLCPK